MKYYVWEPYRPRKKKVLLEAERPKDAGMIYAQRESHWGGDDYGVIHPSEICVSAPSDDLFPTLTYSVEADIEVVCNLNLKKER